jgi:hypothetical protein
MPDANIHDRSSLERLYPRDDFDRDAAENADAKATVHRGITIVSGVDRDGRFGAQRALRHVGEGDPEGDTVFVAPFRAQADAPVPHLASCGDPAETNDVSPIGEHKAQAYQAFLDRIIEAVKTAEFKPAVGCREDRLAGFHGG